VVAAVRTLGTLPTVKGLVVSLCGVARVMVVRVFVSMVTNEADIYGGKEREHQGLHEPDQQLHKVEREEKACTVEKVFAAEHIAKKPN